MFTIKGAGTVATGTLTGECLAVGDEVAVEPFDRRTRIRSLQTHRRTEDRACPVARVAANLVGAERDDLERGDVVTAPGRWRPTGSFDVQLRAVRDLAKPVTSRGAFKVYAGAKEADARIRFLEGNRLEPESPAFARVRTSTPLVLAVGDRVVLREAGRRQTVAGGVVLDLAPSKAALAPARLAARLAASPRDLPALLVQERGAVPVDDVPLLVGAAADPTSTVGRWAVAPAVREACAAAVTAQLAEFHAGEPLAAGAPIDDVRARVAAKLGEMHAPTDRGLVDALIDGMASMSAIERTAAAVRMAGHRVSIDDRDADARRLLEAIGGDHASRPPSVAELEHAGVGRSVVEAAASAGLVVRVSREFVFTPELVARAESVVRGSPDGITVSAFREALDTTRKYALPLLEHFDRTGVTRREGDLRFPR